MPMPHKANDPVTLACQVCMCTAVLAPLTPDMWFLLKGLVGWLTAYTSMERPTGSPPAEGAALSAPDGVGIGG